MREQTSVALALVRALAADPEALSELREALKIGPARDGLPLAYTVVALAEATGVTPRVVRGAIARGELRAVRRGTGARSPYLIAHDDADAWIHSSTTHRACTPVRPRVTSHRVGPLSTAIADLSKENRH